MTAELDRVFRSMVQNAFQTEILWKSLPSINGMRMRTATENREVESPLESLFGHAWTVCQLIMLQNSARRARTHDVAHGAILPLHKQGRSAKIKRRVHAAAALRSIIDRMLRGHPLGPMTIQVCMGPNSRVPFEFWR